MSGLKCECKVCGTVFNRKGKKYSKECNICKNKRTNNARKRIKQYISDYKERCTCLVCGEDNPSVLDLHHIDPKIKEMGLNRVSSHLWEFKRIDTELAKCVVLCANHHRLVHAGKLSLVI